MPRQTLGRGLSALIGEDTVTSASSAAPAKAEESATLELDIDLIEPNPEQPRTRFTDAKLQELAQSIRINGVVQPIVVRPFGGRYQIVAGERRWRASQIAELRRIPAFIREVSDEKLLELALVENIQRQELNPIEEANAYRKLIENIGLTQDQIAERVGKDRTIVTTSLRLLRLANDIQRSIEEGVLTAGHGRALLTTDDPKVRREVANYAIDNGWSVRDIEKAIKRISSGFAINSSTKRVERSIDANVKAAEVKLTRALNTKVQIIPGKKGVGGKIEIEFYSTDDLDRIYDVIIKK
ncbi:MAG: ParB/RepB/Spo0J family partition protein [Chloracidobacterium sp.]|nr:ParB/RepB/Spo0J family partition protein [Chloracidobacterium sp.]